MDGEKTRKAPKKEPIPVLSWPTRHGLTRLEVARLQRRGMEGRAAFPWSPPTGPARIPGLSTGGVIHQSPAQRQLEGRRRRQENIPPCLSPKEVGDDGAGEGGEERKDESVGRRPEAKASRPSYSDLTPRRSPSPSSLVFSTSMLLPRSARTPVWHIPRRDDERARRPGGSGHATPHLGG